jgi:acetylglutamate kinase
VLDDAGGTIERLDPEAVDRLIASGTATAGMIAKLRACEDALSHGVTDVVIVDGRNQQALVAAALAETAPAATRLVPMAVGERRS